MKIILIFTLLVTSLPCMAYIDPASGSAIISALIGLFVALGLTIKNYWCKLKSLFKKNKSNQEIDDQDSEEGT